VDTLVVVARTWSSSKLQEIIREHLDKKVYEYIIDRIDDSAYDPMNNIIKIKEDESRKVYKENDFVREIIEKDREFKQRLLAEDVETIKPIGVFDDDEDNDGMEGDSSTPSNSQDEMVSIKTGKTGKTSKTSKTAASKKKIKVKTKETASMEGSSSLKESGQSEEEKVKKSTEDLKPKKLTIRRAGDKKEDASPAPTGKLLPNRKNNPR